EPTGFFMVRQASRPLNLDSYGSVQFCVPSSKDIAERAGPEFRHQLELAEPAIPSGELPCIPASGVKREFRRRSIRAEALCLPRPPQELIWQFETCVRSRFRQVFQAGKKSVVTTVERRK